MGAWMNVISSFYTADTNIFLLRCRIYIIHAVNDGNARSVVFKGFKYSLKVLKILNSYVRVRSFVKSLVPNPKSGK